MRLLKKYEVLFLALLVATCAMHVAFAQVAQPTPLPSPSGALVDAADGMNKLADLIAASGHIAIIILGLLFTVAKRVSTEKAPKVIAWLQSAVDLLPRLVTSFGKLVNALCQILADALKSDGLGGVK